MSLIESFCDLLRSCEDIRNYLGIIHDIREEFSHRHACCLRKSDIGIPRSIPTEEIRIHHGITDAQALSIRCQCMYDLIDILDDIVSLTKCLSMAHRTRGVSLDRHESTDSLRSCEELLRGELISN